MTDNIQTSLDTLLITVLHDYTRLLITFNFKLFMQISGTEYLWLSSYLDNDSLWLDGVLGWDDTFDAATRDYNIFSFLTGTFFVGSHFALDSMTKFSFLDTMLLNEFDSSTFSRQLFDFHMWDIGTGIQNSSLLTQFFFYTDYQDFMVSILHHSPELTAGLEQFVNSYWVNAAVNSVPSAVFDVFSDTLPSFLSEFLDYFVAFFFFTWSVIYAVSPLTTLKWDNMVDAYLVRLHSYLFVLSRETRVQLEAALTTVFILVLYTSMSIATFDDDQEEMIEFFNGINFYAFLSVFIYFLFRYSTHYFSFLEGSKKEGRMFGAIEQFLKDGANSFALALRFLVLMIRLNMYDTVDDILDSYYVFVGDFDDDEYFSDLLFSIFGAMFFDPDNNDDRSFFFEGEMDFSGDLFSIYFMVWSKFALAVFFLIDEIARMALALYVTYLIIFEIQAVNRSFVEDTYISDKRTTTSKTHLNKF